MDDNSVGKLPDTFVVTLGSSEYSVTAGSSVEIVVTLSNQGSAGEYFKVKSTGHSTELDRLFGSTSGLDSSGRPRKSDFQHFTTNIEEGITGNYLARLQVFGQTAPEKVKKLEILLKILPAVKAKGIIGLHVESSELKATPGSEVKIQLTISNLSPDAEIRGIIRPGGPHWLGFNTLTRDQQCLEAWRKRSMLILHVPAAPEIRSGNIPLKISATSQMHPQIKEEVGIKLSIAAFDSQGRVGVKLGSVQFSTPPGETLTIPDQRVESRRE